MAKKRIILMYITEISGHHSATLAIEQALKKVSAEVETLNINAFNYTNPIAEKIVNRIYMAVIKRTPRIWDYLYDNPAILKRINRAKKTIHNLNSPKLERLFQEFRPDLVACTQAFPCGMVADYKKTQRFDIPLVAVLTDYVPHSYWIYDTIDYYITPSEEVTRRLMNKGVPENKIKSFGIPFDPKFNDPIDKNKIIKKLGLDYSLPTILIMGGGHGLGPIKTILKSLDGVKKDFQEIVVAGSNKKLYNSLRRKIKKLKKRILLFGYAENINELMGISNIIITKPGGITTSEALTKKLPMIIVKPLPGQEASNTAYLTEQHAAIKIEEPKEINLIIESLFDNPDKLEQLSEAAGRISKPNASLNIAKFLWELSNR